MKKNLCFSTILQLATSIFYVNLYFTVGYRNKNILNLSAQCGLLTPFGNLIFSKYKNPKRREYANWNGDMWISYGDWLGAPREERFFTEKRILVKQIKDMGKSC